MRYFDSREVGKIFEQIYCHFFVLFLLKQFVVLYKIMSFKLELRSIQTEILKYIFNHCTFFGFLVCDCFLFFFGSKWSQSIFCSFFILSTGPFPQVIYRLQHIYYLDTI